MRAGVIGNIHGEFSEIESFHSTTKQDGATFTRSLQVNQTKSLEDGSPVFIGEAATQVIEESESIVIESDTGDIEIAKRGHKEGKYTEFVAVPGEFMVVGSGDGTFAFDLLQEQHPGTRVERVNLDLNEYAKDYYKADGVNPWQVGFYGNIGSAEKGVVYGDNVIADSEIGDALDRSQVNQLGLEYEMLGYDMKMTMAESGYIEVYNPSNLESEEFAQYIQEEIMDYIKPTA